MFVSQKRKVLRQKKAKLMHKQITLIDEQRLITLRNLILTV